MEGILMLNKGEYSGDILQMKEYNGIIASRTSYDKNYNSAFHYHENPHVTFIVQGGNLETKKGESNIRKSNDVMFYYAGEWHQTTPTDSNTKNLNLELDIDFLVNNNISENQIKEAVTKNFDTSFYIMNMYSELLFNDSFTESSIHSILFKLVTEKNFKNYQSISWCNQLKQILNDEWYVNHNLIDLALRIGVHPVTISKYFPKYFGCTMGSYMRRLRIFHSLKLIKSGNESLTEIAIRCGFADQSHFTRVFKSYTGFNPSSFRNL